MADGCWCERRQICSCLLDLRQGSGQNERFSVVVNKTEHIVDPGKTWERPAKVNGSSLQATHYSQYQRPLHRQLRPKKLRFSGEILWSTQHCLTNHQWLTLLFINILHFSCSVEQSTGTHVSCHSLMRIWSKSDLLRLIFYSRPQQGSGVTSTLSFSQKCDCMIGQQIYFNSLECVKWRL